MKNIYKYLIGMISGIAAFISIIMMMSNLSFGKNYIIQIITTVVAVIIAICLGYIYFKYLNRSQKIFISYNLDDTQIAHIICNVLRDNGFKVFNIEESVFAGENIKEKMYNLIQASSFFIVIISANSSASDWIKNEISVALKSKKPIIPIRIDDSIIPNELQMIKYIDFKDDKDESKKFLIKSIRNLQKHN